MRVRVYRAVRKCGVDGLRRLFCSEDLDKKRFKIQEKTIKPKVENDNLERFCK